MSRYRIWRYESVTDYAEVDAADEDAAMALIDDGDDALIWHNRKYDSDYDVVDIADEPFITEQRVNA